MINEFRGEHAFLSNFYPSEIEFGEIKYPTVEHAYQAAKTINDAERVLIAMQKTPSKAKKVGQKVSIRPDWEDAKVGIMLNLIRQKFKNDIKLRNKLLATGNEELIEGNTWGDRYWGVCRGEGLNNLGKLLMKVRKELHDTINR